MRFALFIICFYSLAVFAPPLPWISNQNIKIGEFLGAGEWGDVYEFHSPEFPKGAVVKLYKVDGTEKSNRANISLQKLEEYYNGHVLLHKTLGAKAVKPFGVIDHGGMRGIVMESLPHEYYKVDVGNLEKKHSSIKKSTIDSFKDGMDTLIENKVYWTDYNFAVLRDGTVKFFDGDFAFNWETVRGLASGTGEKDMKDVRDTVVHDFKKNNFPELLTCLEMVGSLAKSSTQRLPLK